jgi:peptidoglycan hydrolase-like protein with peptidoglycan-binding domain
VKRRAFLWSAAAVTVAAGAGGAVVLVGDRNQPAATASSTPATGTAKVVRTDLATSEPMYGELGFAGMVVVAAATGGHSYTWLPAPGAVVSPGQLLYEVDGRGVPLLAGDRPAWRPFEPGMTPGPDVAQLNSGLVAIGVASGLAGNPRFGVATAAAVRRWQRALGVPVTGRIEVGEVVFAPAPLRVTEVSVALGAPPEPGTPLVTATGTARMVTLQVPVDQVFMLHVSDPVTVTLPDGTTTTPGTVSAISPVAVTTEDPNQGGGGGGSGRGPAASTVDVSVTLADPGAVAAYNTAPVVVNVTTAAVKGVLAVPVTALLAAPGGGFVVTVVDGTRRRQVRVQAGLFAETLVEVSGSGLAEGDVVEVPA